MEWAALIAWVVTALGGFVMLGIWLRGGGARGAGEAGPRIAPPLVFTHFGLAAGGLVLWIVYLFADNRWMAWVAFAALVVVALLGFTMFSAWLQRRRAQPAGAAASGTGAEPPEQGFPIVVVAGHGIAAVVTVVLVLLTALEVGT